MKLGGEIGGKPALELLPVYLASDPGQLPGHFTVLSMLVVGRDVGDDFDTNRSIQEISDHWSLLPDLAPPIPGPSRDSCPSHAPTRSAARLSAIKRSTREKSLPAYFLPFTMKAGYRRRRRNRDLKNPSIEATSTSFTVTRDSYR